MISDCYHARLEIGSMQAEIWRSWLAGKGEKQRGNWHHKVAVATEHAMDLDIHESSTRSFIRLVPLLLVTGLLENKHLAL